MDGIVLLLVAWLALAQDAPKPAAAAPQPIVPLAASTLATTPDAYVGKTVSVTARVRESLGPTVFTIDQDPARTPAHDVLVLAPLLTAPVQPNGYVTVIGELIEFDAALVAARMQDAAPPIDTALAARFAGRPTLIAASVINPSLTDLARRPPPAMTAEEEGLSRTMKKVGPAFNALRAADASKADEAVAQAALLKQAFADIEPFWKSHARADAIQWTQQARKESDALDAAVRSGRWDEVKAAAGRLQPICQNCHGAYRDRLDDGTYRLKGVVLK